MREKWRDVYIGIINKSGNKNKKYKKESYEEDRGEDVDKQVEINRLTEIKKLFDDKIIENLGNNVWVEHVTKTVLKRIVNEEKAKLLDKKENEIACPPHHKINLETGEITERTREDNWTKEIRFEYKKPSEKAYKRCENLLFEITSDKGKSETLIQILGSALTGVTTRKEFYFIRGPPDSSKSFLCRLVEYVMADFATQASLGAFTGKKNTNIVTELMRLIPYRFTPTVESIPDNILDDLHINKNSGGDDFQCRNPHGKEISFKPQFPTILFGNNFPRIENDVLYEKLVFVELIIRFVNNPRKSNERKKNPTLLDELKADNEFMETLLYMLVEGATKFNKNGRRVKWDHKLPKDVTGNRNSNELLKYFIDEECDTDYEDKRTSLFEYYNEKYENKEELEDKIESEMENFRITFTFRRIRRSIFNKAYNNYRHRYGQKEVAPQIIAKGMENLKYTTSKIKGHYVYNGIELKTETKEDIDLQ